MKKPHVIGKLRENRIDALVQIQVNLEKTIERLHKDIEKLKERKKQYKEKIKPFLGSAEAQLTLKQEMFCREYLASLDASDAYRKAYNVSEKSNDRFVTWKAKILKDSDVIQARLLELRRPILEKLAVSAEKTLRRLMQGQEFDVRLLYHEDGRLKMPHELDEDTAKAVVGVKHDKDGSFEYKIIDVKGCAELLGKHLKLFTDKVETEQKNPIQIQVSGPGFPPEPESIQAWEEQMKEYLKKKQEERAEGV